jgi:uncharacterized membrane protein
MSLSKLLFVYLLTFVVFLLIDMVWLGFIAKDLYKKHLGHLLSEQVNWTAAFIFYLLFVAGIFIFAILPAVEKSSWISALTLGALFGFFTYATYDLTNLATLKSWPLPLVFIDIAWGALLSGLVGFCGFHIVRYFQ